jgi:chromosome segregation ATPase
LNTDFLLKQFEEIEQKVQKLIDDIKKLEEIKLELEYKIEAMDKELQEKISAESNYIEERELIGLKIGDVLEKLNTIS